MCISVRVQLISRKKQKQKQKLLVSEKESITSSAHLLLINSDSLHFQRRIQGDPNPAYHPI